MMHSLGLALKGAWEVLAIGMILGAGLPALFAVGVRAVAVGVGGDAEDDHRRGNPLATAVGVVCFAAVLVAIGLGITVIVASGLGKELAFNGIIPVLVDKH